MNNKQRAKDWDLHQKLVDAVAEYFNKDTAATANVKFSKLRNNSYYGSIVSYPKGKEKLWHKAEGKDFPECLVNLTLEFLKGKAVPTMMDVLNCSVKR